MYIEGEIPSVTTGNNGANYVYPYPPMYGYGNNNGGFFGNGDGIWAILLFAMIFGNGGWGNSFGGGFGGGNNFLYDVNANTNRGFDNLAINNGIDSLQTAVTTGFANAEVGRCNSTTELLQAINGLSSGLQNCCCENRLATADLKYTIATENCADRQAISDGLRDIIANNTANTNAILSKLTQQEIEAKNDQIATLRTQLNMANLAASQTAQTSQIVDSIYNRLDTCPVGTTPVYGRIPIFTCNGNGCGCSTIQ